jgi:hypothetical protein
MDMCAGNRGIGKEFSPYNPANRPRSPGTLHGGVMQAIWQGAVAQKPQHVTMRKASLFLMANLKTICFT